MLTMTQPRKNTRFTIRVPREWEVPMKLLSRRRRRSVAQQIMLFFEEACEKAGIPYRARHGIHP